MSMKQARPRRIQGTNFRWVVPRLDCSILTRKEQYKALLLDRLRSSKTAKKGIKYYSLAIESHADGTPHLDLLIIFQKPVALTPVQLDFLCEKHGELTRYRNLNAAILNYGSKEDDPLTNCPSVARILDQQQLKKDPYSFMQRHMLKAPFSFNLSKFCDEFDFFKTIRGFGTLASKLKIHQEARCNRILQSKSGIREITPELIKERLTVDQRAEFFSWSGYQRIVDYLNEVRQYRSERPFKSKQLLLVGPPNVGKTSLVNTLQAFVAVYPMGVNNWFPRYTPKAYQVIVWNEFRLNLMPYTQLLQFLEGSLMDLEYKGGSTLKSDNPLIIMTSNLSLKEHLWHKFRHEPILLKTATQSLPARVEQLILPPYKDLFFLQKLICQPE